MRAFFGPDIQFFRGVIYKLYISYICFKKRLANLLFIMAQVVCVWIPMTRGHQKIKNKKKCTRESSRVPSIHMHAYGCHIVFFCYIKSLAAERHSMRSPPLDKSILYCYIIILLYCYDNNKKIKRIANSHLRSLFNLFFSFVRCSFWYNIQLTLS